MTNVREMEFHEAASIFPMMSPEEYEGLRDDIAANGLREPIWLCGRKIIDGRNRHLACRELGINPDHETYSGDDPVGFVVSMNLKRRHLSASQKAAAALTAMPMLETEAKTRQASHKDGDVYLPQFLAEGGEARERAAKMFGVNRQYIQDAKAIQSEAPDLFEELALGNLNVPEAKREIAQRKKTERRALAAAQAEKIALPDLIQVWTGDFREKMADLPDESVSLIFTDPPYNNESLPLYADLAFHAARVLKPGGSLLTFLAQSSLRRVIEAMEPPLRYWWIVCIKHGGPRKKMFGPLTYTQWKPMLWFVKDKRGHDSFVSDFVQSSPPDKDLHDWSQGLPEAGYFIEHLTDPGDLVLDPMVGAGTTLIAAGKLKRRAIGIEIDPDRARIAMTNVSDNLSEG